ncbi:MAG TPA: hypothetical protein VK184_27090 [Nostocaceae cyanobacterium]|nr:hypothetical protein [Nostocaceae cyanobacterium]
MIEVKNSESNSVEVQKLFHDITLEQMELISGGNIVPLFLGRNSDVNLSTFHNDESNSSTEYTSLFGAYNNKILTIDFSRITIYLVV